MPFLSFPAYMDSHTVMEEWDASPFEGGFEGLRELQSRRFSGAVEAGTAWLFLRDGDPLAVVEGLDAEPRPGDVDAFEGVSGRAHEAPHPAAASLAAMLALDGEVRGQYYTDDTPLSTVHETLSEGGFTGYVELSENVLSGDYYVVYEDGDEDYLAVIGSSQRLVTGEEAESKAEGEVGIYSVVAVEYPDVEIPAPDARAASSGAAAGADDEAAGDDVTGEAADGSDPATDAEPTADTGRGDGLMVDPRSRPDPEPEPEPRAEPEPEPQTEPEQAAEPDPDPEPEPDSAPERGEAAGADADAGSADRREPREAGSGADAEAGGAAEATDEAVLDGVTTRSVPSLDPERTGRAEGDRTSYVRNPNPNRNPRARSEPEPEPEPRSTPEPRSEPPEGSRERPREASGETAESRETAERVEEVREEYERRLEELESEMEALRNERDRLRERVSSFEGSGGTEAATDGPSLTPAEALAGTSLFVRERTRGEATLEDAHAGRVDRETLASNLRIEYHTEFEDAGATVDGEPFEAWLRSSPRHEFVEWLVVDLLFEVQSTGADNSMRHLYDAIPAVDRVGFDDAVAVGRGQEGRELTFDVVARNRMGDPLFVADIDGSRDPTRAEWLQPLIADAEDVCMDHESLAGAFAVTSSYFEPEALDTAREATSGSFLSREKYRSFVKLARKNGFHLCLVESREGSFHLAMPEL